MVWMAADSGWSAPDAPRAVVAVLDDVWTALGNKLVAGQAALDDRSAAARQDGWPAELAALNVAWAV